MGKRDMQRMIARTTVTLPSDVFDCLRREAKRRRVSVSQVVREALQAHLDIPKAGGKRVIPFAGIFASGQPDFAQRLDEYLAESWVDAIDRDR